MRHKSQFFFLNGICFRTTPPLTHSIAYQTRCLKLCVALPCAAVCHLILSGQAVWNGDGLWLETPLKHFSRTGIAWIWAIIGPNRGKMRSQPPPTSPSEAVENRPLRASKKFELARIISAQNCTKASPRRAYVMQNTKCGSKHSANVHMCRIYEGSRISPLLV